MKSSSDPRRFIELWDLPRAAIPSTATPPTGVGREAWEFLTVGGLPKAIIYGEKDGPAHLSFARLLGGLPPLLQALPGGVQSSSQWSDHFVLGEERFEGGASPFWCLHGPSGRVEVIDLESEDERPRLVNTSVADLAETLLRS